MSVSAITATVVMPCHNGAQFLGAAVQSVLAQSWPQIQLLVVDDGSSDGSGAILASIRRAQASVRVLTQNHKGAYSARNRALRLAEGELVAFLDADDLWSPQFLETMTNELLYNNADLAICGWEDIRENGTSIGTYSPPTTHTAALRLLLDGWSWPIHAAIVRTALVRELGGFSERRQTSMDYDLWLRILAITDKLAFVPDPMAKYRRHSNGRISERKQEQKRDAAEALTYFLREHPTIRDGSDKRE